LITSNGQNLPGTRPTTQVRAAHNQLNHAEEKNKKNNASKAHDLHTLEFILGELEPKRVNDKGYIHH